MRERFKQQLEEMYRQMVVLGGLCQQAIAMAVKTLDEQEEAAQRLEAQVHILDGEIDDMEREIEGLCTKLLLKQQPVATDLRRITAALKMVTDLERIGDQASDIAELARFIRHNGKNEALKKMAAEIAAAAASSNQLGLSVEEIAFYDALTKPQAVKDFYDNDQLVAITKELTEMLRNNRTVDWQKKETARAKMRSMIKRLLKKYKYPPEGQEEALQTVMSQCEMWADNTDMGEICQANIDKKQKYL